MTLALQSVSPQLKGWTFVHMKGRALEEPGITQIRESRSTNVTHTCAVTEPGKVVTHGFGHDEELEFSRGNFVPRRGKFCPVPRDEAKFAPCPATGQNFAP